MPKGVDTSGDPRRSGARREYRSMSKDTLAQYRGEGYSHPTGPTIMFGDKGASIARNAYRDWRRQGVRPQSARTYAIGAGITGGRDSSQGALGYGNL
jgi:hypothetical protein